MKRRKGNGYDPVRHVTQAVEHSGWSASRFFKHARIFTGTVFDEVAATFEFERVSTGVLLKTEHMTSSAAISLADWVLITDRNVVQRRFAQVP